jgi:TRAP-type C4-dicarboxylate transport system substrate-binding protein
MFFCLLFCWTSVGIAAPEYELKVATLAPENSSLMKIFIEMSSELLSETDGRVGFKIFSGFALGDERDVLRKLRIGMIHAATFTSTFLAHLNPEIRVLGVPFLFNNYQEIDYILKENRDYLNQGFSKRGYEILGWSEVGFIYMMSTVPINSARDLKGQKVWTRANSPMANAVFLRAQVSPVAVGTPDVLVALQTNLLEVVYNSPYYALVTQWYSRVKYIPDLPLAYVGGALIISKKALSRLPPHLQETTKRVCDKYLRRLTDRTRKDNEEALALIYKRGVKRTTFDSEDVAHFKELLDLAIEDIEPQDLSRDFLHRIREGLAQYRARQ